MIETDLREEIQSGRDILIISFDDRDMWGWEVITPCGLDYEGETEYDTVDRHFFFPSFQAARNHAQEVNPEFFS